jgi:hypothetical protein
MRKAGRLFLPAGLALALATCACSSQPRAPSFLSPVAYAEGSFATSVALGDLNGDGLTDLAVVLRDALTQAKSVSVFLNNGDGSLAAPVAYSTDAGVGTAAIADLNGDGAADLAVVTGGNACALLNNGDGTFGVATCYPSGAGGAGAIGFGDLNGDGLPDLAVAFSGTAAQYHTDAGVSVFLNIGGGRFTPSPGYLPVANPTRAYGLAVGDLNGDGRPDLVTADVGGSAEDGRASVFINDASGGFPSAVDYRVDARPYGTRPTGVAIADINGDRKADLALTYFDMAPYNAPGGNRDVAVLLGDGSGALVSAANYAAGTNLIAVAAGDVNGDGETDLAVGSLGTGSCPDCTSGSASVLLNDGSGFAQAIDYALPPSLFPAAVRSIALGDLNADGDLDLVFTSERGVAVYLSAPR